MWILLYLMESAEESFKRQMTIQGRWLTIWSMHSQLTRLDNSPHLTTVILMHMEQTALRFIYCSLNVFLLVSSHSNFEMSVGVCAVVDIRKYFGDPLTKIYPSLSNDIHRAKCYFGYLFVFAFLFYCDCHFGVYFNKYMIILKSFQT